MSISFKDLLGKTLTSVTGEVCEEEMIFKTKCGNTYRLYHSQDCCETVEINDINGNLIDLIGSPITMADESSNRDEPAPSEYFESWTWTFYKLATVNGFIDIRWIGQSNGYYSESVRFEMIE